MDEIMKHFMYKVNPTFRGYKVELYIRVVHLLGVVAKMYVFFTAEITEKNGEIIEIQQERKILQPFVGHCETAL
jgi:hypothetical protein